MTKRALLLTLFLSIIWSSVCADVTQTKCGQSYYTISQIFDWYKDDETGEVVWFEGNKSKEGFTNIGSYFIQDSEENFTVYFQNQIIAVVHKAVGTFDEAYTRQIEHMSVEKELENFNPRLTEALLETKDLIKKAILAYAPLPKSARGTRIFNPKFAEAFVKGLLKNPKLLLGKSAQSVANAFKKMGYKTTVLPLRTGRGSKVIIEGHKNINMIKIHSGGGRHVLSRVQITGQYRGSKKLSIKVVQGSKSQYKGKILEEQAAGTKFIFTN